MNRRPDDNERTVIPAPPKAGREFVVSSSTWGHTLPDGLRIAEFEITGLIGEGGFGIVYLAYDHSLQRRVALKEYMPSSLAARTSGGLTVAVKSLHHADAFKAGLRSFVNEARLLAQFDHPSLVKVHRFWEEHGTAYMVMPYYEGPTLKRVLAELGAPPDEAKIREWLTPLLDALAVIHRAQCYHRDIAPDNILLTASGPLLLDFGAARRVIGDMTHALTVVLKPGYAPIEQYGELPEMAQGPWTDLYALACVVYRAATGKTPMPSVERLLADRLQPLSGQAAGRYSPGFLRAIDTTLAVRPRDRPQSVAEFRAMLGEAPAPRAAARPARVAPVPAVPSGARKSLPYALGTGVAVLAAAAWWFGVAPSMRDAAPPAAAASAAQDVAGADAPPPQALVIQSSAQPEVVERDPPAAALAASAAEPLPWPPPAEQQTQQTRIEPPKRPVTVAVPAPPMTKRVPERCSDILQKASLETLTTEEAAFLRRECK
jgi:hypothetical protein